MDEVPIRKEREKNRKTIRAPKENARALALSYCTAAGERNLDACARTAQKRMASFESDGY